METLRETDLLRTTSDIDDLGLTDLNGTIPDLDDLELEIQRRAGLGMCLARVPRGAEQART